MADDVGLLSQSEIDALLAAIGSDPVPAPAEPVVSAPISTPAFTLPGAPAGVTGGASSTAPVQASSQSVPADQIRRYDFRRPERFSKEQIRALRMIHETFARRASVSLSANLRTSIEINLSDIDQDSYASINNHVPELGLYYIVSPLPLPGHLMLHMSLEVALVLVDRMMGGPGLVPKPVPPMGELVMELLRNISNMILADLAEAWATTIPAMRPRIDDISLNLLLIPIALPTDAVAWASFEVRVKGMTGSIILGLPYSVLKPVAGRLSPYNWLAGEQSLSDEKSTLHQDLKGLMTKVKVPVSVTLGTTKLTVQELAALQPGDVLPLGQNIDALCPISVNNREKFLGRAGTWRRKLVVRIEQEIKEMARNE